VVGALVLLRQFYRSDSDFRTAMAKRPPKNAYSGQVVWVTGASSGIGKAVAEEFFKFGARIILSSRDEERLNVVRADLLRRPGANAGDIQVLPLDLSQLETLPTITEQAVKMFGAVDVLVNNAGISMRARAETCSFELDKKLLTVDFLGQVCITKALLPHMIRRRKGHFVNVSSVAGKFGTNLRTAYSAAKFALIGWFDSLRFEVAEYDIHVTNILPGWVATEIGKNALDPEMKPYGVIEKVFQGAIPASLCAELMVRATYNKIHESWIARQPELGYLYGAQYAPNLYRFIYSKIAKKIELKTLAQIQEARSQATAGTSAAAKKQE